MRDRETLTNYVMEHIQESPAEYQSMLFPQFIIVEVLLDIRDQLIALTTLLAYPENT